MRILRNLPLSELTGYFQFKTQRQLDFMTSQYFCPVLQELPRKLQDRNLYLWLSDLLIASLKKKKVLLIPRK